MDRSRTPAPQLRFQRFECKYVLPGAVADEVRHFVAPFTVPDPFAAGRPDNIYRIASLYFDSADLRLHRETIEGIKDRFKLRVRAYSEDPSDPVFIEIKKRRNMVIRKLRTCVPRSELVRLVEEGDVDTSGMTAEEAIGVQEFRTKMLMRNVQPVVLVGYDREAYMGADDRAARVTFDRRIRACPAIGPQIRMASPDWATVEGSRVILELKFNDRCPYWMESAIKRFGLHRTSYSKYSNSLLASRPSLVTSLTGF